MKRNGQILLLTSLVAILALSTTALSLQSDEQELVLEQGIDEYEGTRDTSIYQENQNANGGGGHIFAGETVQGTERRALIAFDLTQIPEGAQITSARLQLTVSRTLSGTPMASIHKLLADWGEGEVDAAGQEGRGGTSQPGDATWQENFKGESSWETPGGDFEAEASATTEAGAVSTKVIFTSDAMTADVQSWIDDPDSNFGWIVLVAGTAKRFFSSENAVEDPGLKPQLTITYVPGESEE